MHIFSYTKLVYIYESIPIGLTNDHRGVSMLPLVEVKVDA